MKEAFIRKKFTDKSIAIIGQVNLIMTSYQEQGYDLSLRQLFYQMVAKDWLPNTQRDYKNLGSLVSDARLAGLLDWDMIKDRGRETHFLSHFDDPADILQQAARQYREDKWDAQPVHIEVMVEKQALEGVLLPVCRELDVRFTANKGYGSISLLYEVGQRINTKIEEDGKDVTIIYLGDHDPSGMDMTRDIEDRIAMFSHSSSINVVRLALNMDQVERWNPPPNTAKQTDSRHAGYVSQFGKRCWELDAISPTDLANLVAQEVLKWRDEDLWDESVNKEEEGRAALLKYAKQYKKEHK